MNPNPNLVFLDFFENLAISRREVLSESLDFGLCDAEAIHELCLAEEIIFGA